MLILLIIKRLVFAALMAYIGVLILKHTDKMLMWFGSNDSIERYLPGGTVSMWKLIGLACVVVGILAIGGTFWFIGL